MRASIEYSLWFLKQRQTACKLTVLQQDLDRPWTNPLAQEHFHLFLSAHSGISLPSDSQALAIERKLPYWWVLRKHSSRGRRGPCERPEQSHSVVVGRRCRQGPCRFDIMAVVSEGDTRLETRVAQGTSPPIGAREPRRVARPRRLG